MHADQWHAEIEDAVAGGETAGGFDFAQLRFGWNMQAGGLLHAVYLVPPGGEEIDPTGIAKPFDGGSFGQLVQLSIVAYERTHHRALSPGRRPPPARRPR